MAGTCLGPAISASAPGLAVGVVAEIRGQAMTGRTWMRHYPSRPARRHGKKTRQWREWPPDGTA
jgi:hypothetical protein